MNKFQKRKNNAKSVALERINELFGQASLNPKYANRYVSLARRISSKLKVRIPVQLKRRFCKNCGVYHSSKTLRIRLNNGKKTYFCLNCKTFLRVPYKP
ncbi:MAG: ribonuclease P [Nanoarchaeota archaeon]